MRLAHLTTFSLAVFAACAVPYSPDHDRCDWGGQVYQTASQPAEESFQPGRVRLGLSGTAGRTETTTGVEIDLATLEAEVGFRLNRDAPVQVELGVIGGIGYGESNNVEVLAGNFGPQARVYFNAEGRVQPWIGIAAVATTVQVEDNDSDDGHYWRAGAGVSVFASDWSAFEFSLEHLREDSDSFSDPIETTQLRIGISTFF